MASTAISSMLLFLTAALIYDVHGCSPKKMASKRCPSPESISECAITYNDFSCLGMGVGITKDQYHTDEIRHILSAVVRRDCLLTVEFDLGYKMFIKGVNGELGTEYSSNPQSKIIGGVINRNKRSSHFPVSVSSLMCSCNDHNGCPNPQYMKPMTKSRKPMCAQLYPHATNDPNTSCFGGPIEVFNGEKVRKIENILFDDEVSAIVVRDGCTFTGYEHKYFQGAKKMFTGVTSKLSRMNNKISSYMCKCEVPIVNCNPSESWKKISICSNPNNATLTCKYWTTYGFTTGNIKTTTQGRTQNIEVTVGLELKEVFKSGITSNTGFNWESSTAFSKAESAETRYIVDYTVPPGQIYALYQLWGQCGQFDVKTKYFEVRNEHTARIIKRGRAQ